MKLMPFYDETNAKLRQKKMKKLCKCIHIYSAL